ncbi:MAG TPA: ABC transporter permease [Chitinophagaceae bacterium]|nr:ABC transporter permease [Chitinophagaceae bacterium]
MPRTYSQSKALWAITKSSFKAIFNHPTAIFFSLLFPIIFILIFGAFGSGGPASYRIALEKNADTNNVFYQGNDRFTGLKNSPMIRIMHYPDTISLQKDLVKGRLSGIVNIKVIPDSVLSSRYLISTRTTTASANTFGALQQALEYLKLKYENSMLGKENELVNIAPPQVKEVRKYRQIDFILPGQLGFSILFATLFGIAFTFFGLREQLVLKRFYASPVRKIHILLGIGTSRLFFQLMNVVVLVLFGYFFLGFTLQHGWLTFVEILVMSGIMLFLLMGVGLIFSSVAKTDNSIPLLINLFGFPQMMLSGTFFPIEVFPKWLQQICNILPLTQFNNAIRKISFEGQHLSDSLKEIGILAIWMIIIYAVLVKVIKWE